MATVHVVLAYLVAHWRIEVAFAAFLITTLMNHNVGGATVQTWYHILLDLLSWRGAAGMPVKVLGAKSGGGTHATAGWKLPLFMCTDRPRVLAMPEKKDDAGPINVASFLPFLLLPPLLFWMTSCAHGGVTPAPNPSTQQYNAAFAQCMEQKGIKVGLSDGLAVLQILSDPSTNEQQKIQALESLGITTVAGGLTDLGACALYAWNQINPMVPGKKPTAGQAAVRVFLARHAAPTMVK